MIRALAKRVFFIDFLTTLLTQRLFQLLVRKWFHFFKFKLQKCDFSRLGIDFKVKTIELRGKKIKLQIW